MSVNGVLVIDKPGGMTSRDVVNRVQKWFPRKTKIGHTGTLDPLATGVLVVCVGAATRLADRVQAMGKSYVSRFRLGATSTTDDADGDITETPEVGPPALTEIDRALASFVGTIDQVPPAFSALKIAGQRAHALARAGEGVLPAARLVRINAIRRPRYEWPFLDVEVDCGKGTYIRSIARDLGGKLGCGGLVQTLRRTRIGPFTSEWAIGLDTDPTAIKLLPLSAALADLPQVKLDVNAVRRFRQGQAIRISGMATGPEVAVLNAEGEPIGIAVGDGAVIRPMLVLNA